jgi:hypothetical protein
MFHKKTRTSLEVLDIWGLLLLLGCGIVLGFKTGNADVLSGQKSHALKKPESPIVTVGEAEGVQGSAAERAALWMVEGEIESGAGGYTCRIACKTSWRDFDFEVIQAARGDERWKDAGGAPLLCEPHSEQSDISFGKGGSWANPPLRPEEGMCWLVLSVERHSD